MNFEYMACTAFAYGPVPEFRMSVSAATSLQPLRIAPGRRITTLTPNGNNSCLRDEERPSMANFVAWYQPPYGEAATPPTEETFTIVPLRRSRISAMTCPVSLTR